MTAKTPLTDRPDARRCAGTTGMSTRGGATTTLRALLTAAMVIGSFGLAIARLPPLNDQQKAAAEEKKDKDAAAAKADAEALSRAQDRVASKYIAEQKPKDVTVTPTPIAAPASAVMTPQGNTPPGAATGLPADAKGASKTNGQAGPATGMAKANS
jgi:hypothetical protein